MIIRFMRQLSYYKGLFVEANRRFEKGNVDSKLAPDSLEARISANRVAFRRKALSVDEGTLTFLLPSASST